MTLILCLCLGGMVILPILNAIDISVLEISEVGPEGNQPSNPIESDDEVFIVTIVAAALAVLFFSKSRSLNLDFQTVYLAPLFPPPKHP